MLQVFSCSLHIMFYVFLWAFSSFSEWLLAFEQSARHIPGMAVKLFTVLCFLLILPLNCLITLASTVWKFPILFVCHVFTAYGVPVKLKWILSVQEVEEVFQGHFLSMYQVCSVLETGLAAGILAVKGTVPAPSSFHLCWKQRNGGSVMVKQNEVWISTA